MRILLIGEYSNVHWTLAQGLRALGHEVTVVSDGDRWKGYRRDISIVRRWRESKSAVLRSIGAVLYVARLATLFPSLKGYDAVQIINPVFLDLKAERMMPYYRYLRRQNGKMFMAAFGMDKYWVKAGSDCHTFRYSDFNIGKTLRENADNALWRKQWLFGAKGRLNDIIAKDCDGIIAGLYEYYASYNPYFAEKLRFIPFPIVEDKKMQTVRKAADGVVKFFVGVQKTRSEYKGTDIMLRALERVKANFPERCEVRIAESVPFAEYVQMLNDSHVLLDQLYSYTPAMNALQAMAQGLVVVSGGEPENYEILSEQKLRPIINVQPNEESVYEELVKLVEHPERIEELSLQSIAYIRHHNYIKVAQQYIDFYEANYLLS